MNLMNIYRRSEFPKYLPKVKNMTAVWLWFRTYLMWDPKSETTVPLGFEMNLLRGPDHYGYRMTFDAFIKLVVKLTQRVEGRPWAGIPI